MSSTEHDQIRNQVRDAYGAIAREGGCGPSCCAPSDNAVAELLSRGIGYSAEEAAGFETIRIAPKEASAEYIRSWAPNRGIENYIASATVEAIKPMEGKQ
jgi:hypothetical protein